MYCSLTYAMGVSDLEELGQYQLTFTELGIVLLSLRAWVGQPDPM